jgi:hypothetical protein
MDNIINLFTSMSLDSSEQDELVELFGNMSISEKSDAVDMLIDGVQKLSFDGIQKLSFDDIVSPTHVLLYKSPTYNKFIDKIFKIFSIRIGAKCLCPTLSNIREIY